MTNINKNTGCDAMQKTKYAVVSTKTLNIILISTCLGILTCAAMLALFTFIFTKSSSLPHSAIGILSTLIGGIGSFIAGNICAKILKSNGMKNGMICAFLMFLLIFICGIITNGENVSFLSLVKLFLMLLFGAVGGILGVNKQKKFKHY